MIPASDPSRMMAFIPGLLVSIASVAPAAPVETFEFRAARFARHPFKSILYATLPDLNSVAIINTQSLTVVDTVFVGSNPNGLSLSPDGGKLFVANSGSSFMGVLDTATNMALPSIQLPALASDVEVGLNGLVYVTPATSDYDIMLIDGESGEFIDDFGSTTSPVRGFLEISPDRTSLYVGKNGGSPSRLAEFDVQGDEPLAVYVNPHGSLGSNGQDLGLSHRGHMIAYPCGGGNGVG